MSRELGTKYQLTNDEVGQIRFNDTIPSESLRTVKCKKNRKVTLLVISEIRVEEYKMQIFL